MKYDGYPGDVKDPRDPGQYSADVGQENGSPVTEYIIKAGPNYYDQNGNLLQDGPPAGYPTNNSGNVGGSGVVPYTP